jgi:hypothetical protein
MNERGRAISERLAWALALGVAPSLDAPEPRSAHAATEAGADRAEWVDEGLAHVTELRDAVHGAINPDSVPESLGRQWEAEGQYLEFLAVSKNELPSLSAWVEDHPDACQELARRAPGSARREQPS